MRRRRNSFNPKRRFATQATLSMLGPLDQLAERVSYGGNPEHKRNPGDFGLIPPSQPRPGKTLCDAARIFRRVEALALLQEGVRRGLVSNLCEGTWPQNVWAVTDSGIPLEAQLENPLIGSYHGYPMPAHDAFGDKVLERWEAR